MGLQYNTAIDMWSLGCICVELFRGIPLFPGNCEYNQLRLIINLLGLPPKDMIEQARHSHKYFTPVYEKSGEYSYRFKEKHEFEAEQGVFLPDLNFQEELTCLDDLVNFQNAKGDKLETKQCFVDFIKGVLQIDPRRRWTPTMSTQHPFILRKKYEGPFVPTRDPSPMISQHSMDEKEENSDSSSVSRRNRSDEIYDKLGSCPSQLLRDPPDGIFNKVSKQNLSDAKMQDIFNNKSYRPPILSLDVEYFKGFNFNSLDAISENFKDMIYNQLPEQSKNPQKAKNAFASEFQKTGSGFNPHHHQQQPMGYHGNMGPGHFPPQQMKFQQPPMPSNMGYNNLYAFGNQPDPYQNFGKSQPMNMGMQNQMMNPQYQMNSQMMPPQQNFGYGYQSMPMGMPPGPNPGFNQNQFYGSQESPGYSLFGSQYSGMNDQFQQPSNSPLWGSTGMASQQPMQHSQFYPQQHQQFYEPQYQGFDNSDFYGGHPENVGYSKQSFGPQGDPHPSLFCNNNPPPKMKLKPETESQMRTGSWDPKFLQKGGIRKFHHNNGQRYMEGQISNSSNMKKCAAYSKVKKNKKYKGKKKNDSNNYDGGNIFTQTFSSMQGQIQDPDVGAQNQVPFLDIGNPPQTAKFSTFNQNLPKPK